MDVNRYATGEKKKQKTKKNEGGEIISWAEFGSWFLFLEIHEALERK